MGLRTSTSSSSLTPKQKQDDAPAADSVVPLVVSFSEESSILGHAQLNQLISWLPEARSINSWTLKYSLRRDGTSLDTLLTLCSAQEDFYAASYVPHVVLIEDSWGYVFGGYIGHALQNKPAYYGNGECFVFSALPRAETFFWTGKNDFFVLSNSHMFAMGGGGEGYAFQVM